MINENLLKELMNKVLVLDTETSSSYSDGNPIDIFTDFDMYLEHAKCKFFGAYSYKHDKFYNLLVRDNEDVIIELLEEHDIIVSFNGESFDVPILKNNNLIPEVEHGIDYRTGLPKSYPKRFLQVDMMLILGNKNFQAQTEVSFKARGALMGYKFPNNKLKTMAQVMKLPVQKGDIDYTIFYKDEWTQEELDEIYMYLQADVEVTKQMFEKTWDFWLPFTEWISEDNIKNLSFIRSSIASLTYKSACHTLGVEETYADSVDDSTLDTIGAFVMQPKYEEIYNAISADYSGLYPHAYAMFNLFNEVPEADVERLRSEGRNIWHGNDLFEVKGYYDITEHHVLSKNVAERLKERIYLKHHDPTNPKIYALKIFLNSLYGSQRSPIFEKIHTPNGGADCCRISQTMIFFARDFMEKKGFEVVYIDTDSLYMKMQDGSTPDEVYTNECLEQMKNEILAQVPFPVDTFGMMVEHIMPYLLFPFSEQTIQDEEGKNIKEGNRLVKVRKGKKKFYIYIYEKDGEPYIKLNGIPLIKENGTQLSKLIYKDILRPLILKRMRAKFTKKEMDYILERVLQKDGTIELLGREFKCKPASTYKNPSQINAQISTAYFGGQGGQIFLIKNKKTGRVGKGMKYATIEEIKEAGLTINDIDLTKLHSELEPFILYEEK